MKKEIADRWVAELRSGRHKQGKRRLNFDGRKCCLGVLCELAVLDGVVERRVYIESNRDVVAYGYDGADSLLPGKVQEWAGIESDDARFDSSVPDDARFDSSADEATSLVNANDTRGMDFNQIADLIEARWESL